MKRYYRIMYIGTVFVLLATLAVVIANTVSEIPFKTWIALLLGIVAVGMIFMAYGITFVVWYKKRHKRRMTNETEN